MNLSNAPAIQTTIFDGETFDRERDAKRLTSQLYRVREYMLGRGWCTLDEIVEACGGTTASVSARIRDHKKPQYQDGGPYLVESRCRARGLWEYRIANKEA